MLYNRNRRSWNQAWDGKAPSLLSVFVAICFFTLDNWTTEIITGLHSSGKSLTPISLHFRQSVMMGNHSLFLWFFYTIRLKAWGGLQGCLPGGTTARPAYLLCSTVFAKVLWVDWMLQQRNEIRRAAVTPWWCTVEEFCLVTKVTWESNEHTDDGDDTSMPAC